MAWNCNKCGKIFAKQNQSHICLVFKIEDLLSLYNEDIQDIYLKIIDLLKINGINFRITNTDKAITLYAENHISFLTISLKKKFIDVWFTYSEKIDNHIVYKFINNENSRIKNKVIHFIRFYEISDINQSFIEMIKLANEFILKSNK